MNYQVIDGLRLLLACKEAGLKTVSCTVLDVDRNTAIEIMHILNSGSRKITYALMARKISLLEAHAKKFLKEARGTDNEFSEMTVRQYVALVLQMSERSLTEFKAIATHPDKDRLIDDMDKGLMSLHRTAGIARGEKPRLPIPKDEIPLGSKPVITCEKCPRRDEFLAKVETYEKNDDAKVTGGDCQNSEVCDE